MARVSPGQPIRIAIAVPAETNVAGMEAIEHQRGAEMAILLHGPIQGFPVELQMFDSGCESRRASGMAQSITIDLGLAAVIGHTCAVECEGAARVYEDSHFTSISPGCSASRLTDELRHIGSFVRVTPDDAIESSMAAQFAYLELAARRALIIHDGTLESSDRVAAFQATFAGLGGEIVGLVDFDRDEADFLAALPAGDVDVIYLPLLAPAGIQSVTFLSRSSLAGVPLLGGRSLWNTDFTDQLGRLAEGVYAAGPMPAAGDEAVLASYREQFSSQPSGQAFWFAYDAAAILLKAIDDVAVISEAGDLQIGRQALREALYGTVNFPGTTGLLTCSEWGDCSAGQVAVGQVHGGEWDIVYLPR
jgi:branched-chain amino acid transport system substrate-binding protein